MEQEEASTVEQSLIAPVDNVVHFPLPIDTARDTAPDKKQDLEDILSQTL